MGQKNNNETKEGSCSSLQTSKKKKHVKFLLIELCLMASVCLSIIHDEL